MSETASSERTHKSHHFRRRLIAGMIVIAPVTVTAAVLWWLFNLVDGLLGQFLYPALPFPIPGLGLVLLVIILFVIGWGAELAVGSRIVAFSQTLFERMPITRRIYGAANRIVRTVFGEDSRPFKAVVLVEWPAPGRWSIGFLAGAAPGAADSAVDDGVSVFMPTTPNPTTGFLTVVARSAIIEVDMTVDQAFTFILSAGAATPESLQAAGMSGGRPGSSTAGAPYGAAVAAAAPIGAPRVEP